VAGAKPVFLRKTRFSEKKKAPAGNWTGGRGKTILDRILGILGWGSWGSWGGDPGNIIHIGNIVFSYLYVFL